METKVIELNTQQSADNKSIVEESLGTQCSWVVGDVFTRVYSGSPLTIAVD